MDAEAEKLLREAEALQEQIRLERLYSSLFGLTREERERVRQRVAFYYSGLDALRDRLDALRREASLSHGQHQPRKDHLL